MRFEIFKAMEMWVVAPCSLVGDNHIHIYGNCVSLKRWYLPASQQGVTTQNIIIKTSNLTYFLKVIKWRVRAPIHNLWETVFKYFSPLEWSLFSFDPEPPPPEQRGQEPMYKFVTMWQE
jgi:hypothetical protein